MDCKECLDTGEIDCEECEGPGMDDDGDECPQCGGLGNVECEFCPAGDPE